MSENTPATKSTGLRSWLGSDPLVSLRGEMDDLFRRFSDSGGWLSGPVAPSLDLTETNGNFEIKVDLPGYKAEEIDVEVHQDVVRISGEHKEEKKEDKEEKGRVYHRTERRHGSFNRMVTLPCAVKDDKVKADYADGVLTVILPKTEDARSHKVKVQAKA